MVSRENEIILVCIVAALPLGFAVASVEGAPDWAAYLVLVAVGVVLPGFLTGRYRPDGA
ncbi:hypothetical protein M0R88_00890 [Halorussus gelatinilyticus]|uniref:Uncharacterized protein n=1 Tax=Halorussus gelatinilyticus TaxID=2937524 RepID=A0A8U0IKB8_9EURY|nr:hypothetical protein [Halorussus gelatinilyticus]UPW00674.1 hypothetical protein M0R88_00890 [Halorussus gelatinilyticus]